MSVDRLVGGVRAAQERLKLARGDVEARLRVMLEAELVELTRARDVAVRKAFEGGVSKAELKRALGTKDHATVQRILSGGSATVSSVTAGEQVALVAPGECVVSWVEWQGEVIVDPVRCVFGRNESGVWFEPMSGEGSRVVGLLADSLASGDTSLYEYVCGVVDDVA
jgi:hypothetical protein